MIDGAGSFAVPWRSVVPLIRPSLIVVAALTLIAVVPMGGHMLVQRWFVGGLLAGSVKG